MMKYIFYLKSIKIFLILLSIIAINTLYIDKSVFSQEIVNIYPQKIASGSIPNIKIEIDDINIQKKDIRIIFINKKIHLNTFSIIKNQEDKTTIIYCSLKISPYLRSGWYDFDLILYSKVKIKSKIMIYRPYNLIQSHDDYDNFFIRLRIGYELTSFDNLKETSFPRYGLLINYTLTLSKNHGIHLHFFSDLLATSIEKEEEDIENTNLDDETQIENNHHAFESTGNIFFNFIEYDLYVLGENNRFQLGILCRSGAFMLYDRHKLHKYYHYYSGLRFSLNPELFGDLMLGKSENLKGLRILIRLKTPIYRMDANSRLYLGANLNQAVDNKENDSYQVYASFNINPIDLIIDMLND